MGFLGFRENEVDLLRKIIHKLENFIKVIQRSSAQDKIKSEKAEKTRKLILELHGFEIELGRNISPERREQISEEITFGAGSSIPKAGDAAAKWFFDLPENERKELAVILSEIEGLMARLADKLKQ